MVHLALLRRVLSEPSQVHSETTLVVMTLYAGGLRSRALSRQLDDLSSTSAILWIVNGAQRNAWCDSRCPLVHYILGATTHAGLLWALGNVSSFL